MLSARRNSIALADKLQLSALKLEPCDARTGREWNLHKAVVVVTTCCADSRGGDCVQLRCDEGGSVEGEMVL